MSTNQDFNATNDTIVRSYPKVPHPTKATLWGRANPVIQLGKFVGFCSLILAMVAKGHDPKQDVE